MNIELIAEPLLITERSASEDLEAVDQAGDSQPQAAIVRVTVADRVGVLSNINSSERKKGSPTWRSADPTLPVADNLLRQGELGGGLSPALLFLIEVRRVSR